MGLCSIENDVLSKQGQLKLYQLQALLFDCERSASDPPDTERSERILCSALKLLGFLKSEASADPDTAVLVQPLLRECRKHLEAARATASSDEEVLQRASCGPGFKFQTTGNPNLTVERLSRMRPYRPLNHSKKEAPPRSETLLVCKMPTPATAPLLWHPEGSSNTEKQGRGFTQMKLPSLFNKGVGDCDMKQCDAESGSQGLFGGMPWEMPEPSGNPASATGRHTGNGQVQAGATVPTKRANPYEHHQQPDASSNGKKQKALLFQEEKSHGNEASQPKPCASRDREGTRDRDDEIEEEEHGRAFSFVTATQKLSADALRGGMASFQKSRLSYGMKTSGPSASLDHDSSARASAAFPSKIGNHFRRGARNGFAPPARLGKEAAQQQTGMGSIMKGAGAAAKKGADLDDSTLKCLEMLAGPDGELPECLRNLEPRLLEHVSNEIMTKTTHTTWADIAGLEHAKRCVDEMVIWPLKRPDLFRGTRKPGTGLLLYGPPGTGKTLIGRAIAGESKATFFSISASSLTSKWIGEGEKLVRALFGVASCRQPAVIFVDEIDSLLSQRKSDGEHESSRRLKTQFLIEMEGCGSGDDQILLIGATNRPQELDEAARRRMTKRLYIPLPEEAARAQIIRSLLQKDELLSLSEAEVGFIAAQSEGFSGSDMTNLVKDAAMAPMREVMRSGADIDQLKPGDIRPLSLEDFKSALQRMRPSVAPSELKIYEDWSNQFGSGELNGIAV